MPEIYAIPKSVLLTSRYHLVESEHEKDNRKVFIQTVADTYPGFEDLAGLKNDYEISKGLNLPGVLGAIEITRHQSGIAIVKDFFEGVTLDSFLKEKKLSIPDGLQIILQIAKTIRDLHKLRIIHKNLCPENILISPETLETKICSLTTASIMGNEREISVYSAALFDSLNYISPEQTGRMNRFVDYRTDFYSLGIFAYHVLCGCLPFDYRDAMELIHAHIAKNPKPLYIVNDQIPQPVSDIVMKLMAKNAEDRYQSAEGICADLEYCITQLENEGTFESFIPGSKDNSPILSISEKLYGRDKEINTLLDNFHSIKGNGIKMILFAGYSGIGKTSLINEVHKPIARDNGLFISGKFDQYKKETPFHAFSQAISAFTRQILSKNQHEINTWKQNILTALKEQGQVVTDIVPELEMLIGKQPPLLRLGITETKNRFLITLQNFLRVLATPDHPLAIFIDDLQWADSGSFELLYSGLTNAALSNILLIGAYRDNEVDESHPLMLLLERLKMDAPGKVQSVFLKELQAKEVNEWVADSLRQPAAETNDLTAIIIDKTQGNPFFIKQFILELSRQNLISYNLTSNKWRWNIDGIRKLNITDNVVALMVNKLRLLNEENQRVVSIASVIGNNFDLETLAQVSGIPENKLSQLLSELVQEGLIIPTTGWTKHYNDTLWSEIGFAQPDASKTIFRFQHDRIQQAAYSLIPPAEHEQLHLKTGKILLSKYENNDLDDHLFEILNHLNYSASHINEKTERDMLAAFNLKAGTKAKNANAYLAALKFFEFGMLFSDNRTATVLYNDLLVSRSECEYLCGNHETSEKLFDEAIASGRSNIEKANVYARKMQLYENTNRQVLAIETALLGLQLVGIKLPGKPGPLSIMGELVKVKLNLRGKSMDWLKQNRNMDNPELLIAMNLLANLWGPAYLHNPNLLALAILRLVNLSVKHGNAPESALAYAFFGYVSSAQLKDYKGGIEFARLGVWINEKFDDLILRAKVLVIYAGCVAHWTVKFDEILPDLYRALQIARETNDLVYAAYAGAFINKMLFVKGEHLQQTINITAKNIHFARQIQSALSLSSYITLARMLYLLSGQELDKNVFLDTINKEDHVKQLKEMIEREGTPLAYTSHFVYYGMWLYFINRYEESTEHFIEAQKTIISILGLVANMLHSYYSTLAFLALAIEKKGPLPSSKLFKANRKQFKKLSEVGPANYKSKHLLIEAEIANLQGEFERASRTYNLSIQAAIESGIIQDMALSKERAARFYLKNGLNDIGMTLMREALSFYMEWGAEGKVNGIKKEFSGFESIAGTNSASEMMTRLSDSSSLDLQSIVKAATSISGEIVFEKLLDKLLNIVQENAGADKTYLIMVKNNHLYAEARIISDKTEVSMLNSLPFEKISDVSRPVIQLCYHSNEAIILNDAVNDARFSTDEYIQECKPKSVFCLPIMQYGKCAAIVYMENNLSKDAFTTSRIEVLNILGAQIAISLENAQLYESVEQKVIERTYQLSEEKGKSESLLLNILPLEVAEELKNTGKAKAKKYQEVTVMFTDFKNFTQFSEISEPEELVAQVDLYFRKFDQIITSHGLEKIKTIGDAYLCVGGMPVPDDQGAIKIVRAAIEMRDFVLKLKKERQERNETFFEMRIGINTGSVVAGIVGERKFAYDIWGDAVNTAARFEQEGETGKVNISEDTYNLVKDHFVCTHRGKIPAKNKGHIDMYFVESEVKRE